MNLPPGSVRIPFVQHLGLEVTEATPERAVVVLQDRPELLNSLGAMHGGVLMTMLDLVMTWAVRGHYGIAGSVITVDMSVGFMKAGFGQVQAEGRVLHAGKSTAFCESEAKDQSGALLAKAIGTFKLLSEKKAAGQAPRVSP